MAKALTPRKKRKLEKELLRCKLLRGKGFRSYAIINSFWISVVLGASIAFFQLMAGKPALALFTLTFMLMIIFPVCVFFHSLLWWSASRKIKRIERRFEVIS